MGVLLTEKIIDYFSVLDSLGIITVYRFLDGVADAAAWNAVVSILIVLYPNNVSTVMSWIEMLYGLGYMIGNNEILLGYPCG